MPDAGAPMDTTRPIAELEQKSWRTFGERHRFVLYTDRLEVERSWLLAWERRVYPIGAMPEKPDNIRSRWWTRIVPTVCMVGVGAFVTHYVPSRDEGFFWGPLLISSGLILAGLLAVTFRNVWVLIYGAIASQGGQLVVPKVVVHVGLPCRQAVADFMEQLTKARKLFAERFEGAGAAEGLSDARALERFAELHRRGILTDSEFARVKDHVLETPRGSVGFGPR